MKQACHKITRDIGCFRPWNKSKLIQGQDSTNEIKRVRDHLNVCLLATWLTFCLFKCQIFQIWPFLDVEENSTF